MSTGTPDDDPLGIQAKMLPPADGAALRRESAWVFAWCMGLTAALFVLVYLLT
ncbi:hypothetical protein [Frankia sp. ACN1ag]|uniref:hypothetical protein n=1 Tax=Frankia sp. ACN1ag TaxID=102891 RepID=UPI000B0CF5D3|nr:hypothetical protein [Frankia sp. ACN1ag]